GSYSYFQHNNYDRREILILEISEYIEFLKTDKPLVYEVKLVPMTSQTSNVNFWWVNQGQSYRAEREGGFLWAPLYTKRGTTIAHHRDLEKAKAGDLVFCYSNTELRAVGIVKEEARQE